MSVVCDGNTVKLSTPVSLLTKRCCVLQLERAYEQVIFPLENFRKEHIGGVKVSAL